MRVANVSPKQTPVTAPTAPAATPVRTKRGISAEVRKEMGDARAVGGGEREK
jgi:hypothetical protein